MPNFDDLSSKKFGNWTVLRRVSPVAVRKSNSTVWLCQCACGKKKERLRSNIVQGKNRGCGCRPWNLLTKPYEALYRLFLREAKRSKRFEGLTYKQFLAFTKKLKCHYCGAPLKWARHSTGKNGGSYNLDRKDNSRGYFKNNCVACCGRCNRAKSRYFTYSEWKQIGELIKKWRSNGNDQKNVGTEKES